MKILKKFFLVSLFCSLFVVSASAATIDFQYSDKVKSFVNDNSILLDNAANYIKEHANEIESTFNDSRLDIINDKNVLFYPNINFNNDSFSVMILANCDSCHNGVKGIWLGLSYFWITLSYDSSSNEILSFTPVESTIGSTSFNIRYDGIGDRFFDWRLGKNTISVFTNESGSGGSYDLILNSNNDILSANSTFLGSLYDFALTMDYGLVNLPSSEPTYSYTSNVLENGNVELTFTFENYDSDSSYGFTIENEISGEEYGIENPFSSIFPNIVPFGNSYSITIPYDTYLYVTLAKYNKIEDSTLYFREEIFTDVIDINNIFFSNSSNPYYSIDYQSQKFIQGRFNNTKKSDTCFVKFSNNSESRQVSCSGSFTINYDFNGFLTFYVKRNNDIIYNRNINVLGNDSPNYPYITYNIQKQDFYSVVTFNVINDNYDINMSYRYSLDNGVTWTDYQLIDKEPFSYSINVFSNSNVIFEIANVRSSNIIVYDSKSVYVVLDISTASGLNSSTDNIIDKFISLISINDNLVNYINLLWNNLKNSKLFLIIMIPFISSIICGIIYLIRRL